MAAPPHAVVNAESHKGEDTWSTLDLGRYFGYGVFDGHGGDGVSKYCASAEPTGILPQLLQFAQESGRLPSHEHTSDVFWLADARCGPVLAARGGHGRAGGGAHAGSTACVLLVEAQEMPDRGVCYQCMFVWAGDSTGITVDMKSGKLGPRTPNHVPDAPTEAARLELLTAVGTALHGERKEKKRAKEGCGVAEGGAQGAQGGSQGESSAAVGVSSSAAAEEEEEEQEAPVTAADVAAALEKAGVSPTAHCPSEMILRACQREQLMARTIPKGRKYRLNAVVSRRPRQKDENEPWNVATHEDPYSSHYRDLLMTRSICDWTKSAWVLPQPDVLEFTVPMGKHVRAVLASDGLWDICTHEQAAEIVRRSSTVQLAAEALLDVAKSVYIGERGLEKMGDDTTVMVVDLAPQKARVGGASASSAHGHPVMGGVEVRIGTSGAGSKKSCVVS